MTSDEDLSEIADTLGQAFDNANQGVTQLAAAFRMAAKLDCAYCGNELRLATLPNSNTIHACCPCCEEESHPDHKLYDQAKVDKPV